VRAAAGILTRAAPTRGAVGGARRPSRVTNQLRGQAEAAPTLHDMIFFVPWGDRPAEHGVRPAVRLRGASRRAGLVTQSEPHRVDQSQVVQRTSFV
jgi:hypothetical protein